MILPYIIPERRKRYEDVIQSIVTYLQEVPEEQRDGEINYIVSVILRRVYQPPKYYRYNRAIGVLECIKQELYRRVVSKYEDKKIIENGDIR